MYFSIRGSRCISQRSAMGIGKLFVIGNDQMQQLVNCCYGVFKLLQKAMLQKSCVCHRASNLLPSNPSALFETKQKKQGARRPNNTKIYRHSLEKTMQTFIKRKKCTHKLHIEQYTHNSLTTTSNLIDTQAELLLEKKYLEAEGEVIIEGAEDCEEEEDCPKEGGFLALGGIESMWWLYSLSSS